MRIHKRLRAEVGIGYTRQGWLRDRLNSNPWLQNNPYVKNDLITILELIEVPLKLVYRSETRKVKFHAAVGIVVDHFVRGGTWDKTVTHEGVVSIQGTYFNTTSNRTNVSPYVSVGIDLMASRLLGLRIEPFFQHNAIDRFSSSDRSFYLWYAGVGIVGYIRH